MAKNHKNLEYILTTIRDNPGVTAANVQRLLMFRNGKPFVKGQSLHYGWYFHGGGNPWCRMQGIEYGYWTKKGRRVYITDTGQARLAKFGKS